MQWNVIKGWKIVDGSSSSSSRPSKEASNRACLRMTMNCAAIVTPVGPGLAANLGGTSSIAQQKQAIITGSMYFSKIRLFLIANKMQAQVKAPPMYSLIFSVSLRSSASNFCFAIFPNKIFSL